MTDVYVQLYEQSWRRYHNLDHISDVFGYASILKEERSIETDEAFAQAVMGHDAIYVPGATGCEEASALLVESLGLPVSQAAADLIRYTAKHLPPLDNKLAVLLCDADLYGLSVNYEENRTRIHDEVKAYAELIAGVWHEDMWSVGRRVWLGRFLGRPRIFSGPDMEAHEQAARANLRQELDQLTVVST